MSFFGSIRDMVSTALRVRYLKSDIGGNEIVTGVIASAPGDVSHPIASDIPVLDGAQKSGSVVVLGYVDGSPLPPINISPGERVMFSRNSAGDSMSSISLLSDGSVIIANASGGSIAIDSSGSINLNGVIIDALGNISVPGNLDALSVSATLIQAGGGEVVGHTHGGTTAPFP